MKYSLIITAWKEPVTLSNTLESILVSTQSNYLNELEILIVCPDDDSFDSSVKTFKKNNFKNYRRIQDKQEGKPKALNMGFAQAKGDIWIMTDGDVQVSYGALNYLLHHFDNKEVGAVTGRPFSLDSRYNLFGYWGNLLADAAHHKRSKLFTENRWYFLSGYLYAMRRIENFKIPEGTLIDDAWITLEVLKKGLKIKYEPEAKVGIKYPKNFSEWIRQKQRSVGGYSQISRIIPAKNNRNIIEELKYFFFPLRYARSAKEFTYSLLLYPSRLYLWIRIFIKKSFNRMDLQSTWVRIESTKN